MKPPSQEETMPREIWAYEEDMIRNPRMQERGWVTYNPNGAKIRAHFTRTDIHLQALAALKLAKEALEDIRSSHLPDCPAAREEIDVAHTHIGNLRTKAFKALAEISALENKHSEGTP